MNDSNVFLMISIFAISALIVNSIGIYVIYRNMKWVEKYKEYFMCFAAGVLISAPLISAFPEAIEKNHNAGFAALIGFVFMLFSNKLIKHHTKQEELAFGITAIQGIGIHSLLDGIIYTVTFSASIFTGLVSGIGLVIHEFTEGVITFSVLVKGGIKTKKAILYAFLVAGLTTPVGAFVAYPLVKRLSDSTLGLALGFVVGVLIYISAAHLLPEAKAHEKKHSMVALCLGIVLSLAMSFLH
ncbi:MAG TPA: ZIP family metal transporter [Clostridia bacterium]|nr:ZIP family metal transporter [Clostridia bacterium]